MTPVFYIYMDRLQKRLARRKGSGRPSAPPLVEPERARAREEEPVPATAALRLRDV